MGSMSLLSKKTLIDAHELVSLMTADWLIFGQGIFKRCQITVNKLSELAGLQSFLKTYLQILPEFVSKLGPVMACL